MLVVFFGKAGILADHDGLAGVDVLEHPDNEAGLSIVPRVKPGKYTFECHKKVLLPLIFYSIAQISAERKSGVGTEKTGI